MIKIETIDLHFQGLVHAIAAYLIPSSDGPILIETGPYSTFPYLKKGIESHGYQLSDIKHVFLTHIHLDHAGAAWAMAEAGADIYLHPFGAKNLEDPSKLMASAKMIYQDKMDKLWGQMKPIASEKLIQVADQQEIIIGEVTLKSWHTPGHARHHIAWQVDDIIFTGDVAGVKIDCGPVVPPCPPPDINIEDWKNSIQLLKSLHPKALYLTHYHRIENIAEHLGQLTDILDNWADWIKTNMDEELSQEEMIPLFMAHTASQLRAGGLSDEDIVLYEAANPSWMSVAGLVRYWEKKLVKRTGRNQN